MKKHEDLDAFLEVVEQHLKEARERWSWTRNFLKHSSTGQKIALGGLASGTVIGAYTGGQREWRKTRKKRRKRYIGRLARASRVFGGVAKGALSGAIGGAITGYGVGHAADYISRGSRAAEESIDEGVMDKIKDTINQFKKKLKSSKKIYTHLEKGVSGRTPPEIESFKKKASLYRNWVTAKKVTPWAIGGAAALTVGTTAGVKYLKHRKREKSEMAKLTGRERQAYKRLIKKRKMARRAGALGGATVGLIASTQVPIPYRTSRQLVRRTIGIAAAGTGIGALTGYIASMAKQPSRGKLRRKAKRDIKRRLKAKQKATRYESVEDVVNSLLYEEDESEN